MIFHTRYDEAGAMVGIHMNGGDFDHLVKISKSLIECADPRFLRRDGDTITITCDEGRATYHVTSEDRRPTPFEPTPDAVRATLVSVERAAEVNA